MEEKCDIVNDLIGFFECFDSVEIRNSNNNSHSETQKIPSKCMFVKK